VFVTKYRFTCSSPARPHWRSPPSIIKQYIDGQARPL
jgi:hypothetical protein